VVLRTVLDEVLEGVSSAVPVLQLSVVQHFIHVLDEPDVTHVAMQVAAHA
jgi:hypothetical protein